jgi:hypothetical protein
VPVTSNPITDVPVIAGHSYGYMMNAVVGATVCNQSAISFTVSATPIPGVVGPSHGQSFSSAPTGGLCTYSSITPTVVGTGPWTWVCTGLNGGASANGTAYKLSQSTVTVEKSYGGVVKSNDTYINCGLVCSKDYDAGSSITFTAQPDLSWKFMGWEGDCTGTGTCQLTNISSAKWIKALFSLKPLIYQEF